ncbi:ABC transporter substrate-binding protein [Muricoccus radiodurans]|uniref:ABC transporter substrate-binding protein n=1 Tax=Muricoccus radiodurans TaxID=2231721 RepID=UPI003CF423FC
MTQPEIGRRSLLRAALVPALAPLPVLSRPARAQAPLRITDLAGRTVTLPRPARRIVLQQARHVLALSLLHPDPVSLIVGWGGDLRQMNPPDYASVRARFPAADAVPLVGRNTLDTLSIEMVVASRPDAVVLSRGGGGGGDAAALADRLSGYGIPTVVVDFFVNPLRDTPRSIEVLGTLLGQEERARAFGAFHAERLARITERLAGVTVRPSLFMHAHAGGTTCCASPGRGAFDSFIRAAGGTNIGAEILPGLMGEVSLEQVLTRNPDVYVATGGPFAGRGGIAMGAGVAPDTALRDLRAVLTKDRLVGLPAVTGGRAHAMWHGFNDTPAHIMVVEALARALHPTIFADLDPAATQAELNRRFLSIPMEGTYWANLPGGRG